MNFDGLKLEELKKVQAELAEVIRNKTKEVNFETFKEDPRITEVSDILVEHNGVSYQLDAPITVEVLVEDNSFSLESVHGPNYSDVRELLTNSFEFFEYIKPTQEKLQRANKLAKELSEEYDVELHKVIAFAEFGME